MRHHIHAVLPATHTFYPDVEWAIPALTPSHSASLPFDWYSLSPPYRIGQAIIFLPCGFFYLSVCLCLSVLSYPILYLSIYLLVFPRLISANADWMSAILAHMVWPSCEFRMQIWNVLHAARWNNRTQKNTKIRHLGTIAQLCRAISSQLRHVSTIGKNFLNSNTSRAYPYNMVNLSAH